MFLSRVTPSLRNKGKPLFLHCFFKQIFHESKSLHTEYNFKQLAILADVCKIHKEDKMTLESDQDLLSLSSICGVLQSKGTSIFPAVVPLTELNSETLFVCCLVDAAKMLCQWHFVDLIHTGTLKC